MTLTSLFEKAEYPQILEYHTNSTHLAEGAEVFYHFRDSVYDGCLELEILPVLRHTPRAVWLDYYGINKLVRTDPGGRRFAYASKADALNSYIRRKEWQLKHLQRTMNKAQANLALAKEVKL